MDGVLPVDKPGGVTSYDVIRQVKRLLPRGIKIGHAGTLDPFAEGVLLILFGKATKGFGEIQTRKKTYLATARLGASSDTLDRMGMVIKQPGLRKKITKEEIEGVAKKYVGRIEQVVPRYAAAKHKGRKLYEYAREGKEIPQKSKKVRVYSIEVIWGNQSNDSNHRIVNQVSMRVTCGSGTYIRQLSYDILKELGVESYLEGLVREQVGDVTRNDCVRLAQLTSLEMVVRRLQPFPGE